MVRSVVIDRGREGRGDFGGEAEKEKEGRVSIGENSPL